MREDGFKQGLLTMREDRFKPGGGGGDSTYERGGDARRLA